MKKETKQEITLIIIIIISLAFLIGCAIQPIIERDKAINAAEMQAYNLVTPLDVASFGTSLSRKHREDPDDIEVKDHDDFIDWVKYELTKIGV